MLPAYFLVWYLDVTIKKWGFPTLGSPGSSAGTKQLMTSYRNICMGAILPTVKRVATKVARELVVIKD